MGLEGEIDRLPTPNDWLLNDSLFTHQLYPQKNYLVVHAYVHHLINLAELRDTVEEQPIDAVLLGKLRDSANVFVTMGKTTANHLPLPRSEFNRGNFTYQIGENSYECKTIVPATHNSPNFIAKNSNLLPASDFRNEFVITETTEKGLQTRVIETDLKTPTSIARKVSEQPLEKVYEHTFGETENGEPWAVRIFSDTTKPDVFWIETMVDTSEFGEGRANTTPFLTRIKSDSSDIQMLITQLEKPFNNQQSEFDLRKIVYYLSSVIYFQSDVNKPYLPETVVPTYLNPNLPNLYNILVRAPLGDIPDIISSCLNENDGIIALQKLAQINGGKLLNFDSTQESLKKFFADQYDIASESLKQGMRTLLSQMQNDIAGEISETSELEIDFLNAWDQQKAHVLNIFSQAFALPIRLNGDQNYLKITSLCELDLSIEKIIAQLNTSEEIDVIIKSFISDLFVRAFLNYVDQMVKADGRYEEKKHMKPLKEIWGRIRSLAQKELGLEAARLDYSILGPSDNAATWEKRFPDSIRQLATKEY